MIDRTPVALSLDMSRDKTERSAYVAVCEAFNSSLPTSRELHQLNPGFSLLNTSVFDVEQSFLREMIARLRPVAQRAAAFQSLSKNEQGDRLFHAELRYCLPCLRAGNHSCLFQYGLVSKCPLHQVTLAVGCPNCGQRLETDLETLRLFPFCCASCGQSLSQPVPLDVKRVAPPIAPFNQIRLRLGFHLSADWESSRSTFQWKISQHKRRGPPDAGLLRIAMEHFNWIESEAIRRASWCDLAFELPVSNSTSEDFVRARTVLETLQSLRENITLCGIQDSPPGLGPWFYASSLSTSDGPTVAAAALYRTANLYGVLEVFLSPVHRSNFLLQTFGPLPSEVAAAELVVEYEVIGLFLRCLSAASKYRYASEVAWHESAAPETFCPAWRFHKGPMRTLQMKPLGTMGRVVHIIKRLGMRRLGHGREADEQSILKMIFARSSDETRRKRTRKDPRLDLLVAHIRDPSEVHVPQRAKIVRDELKVDDCWLVKGKASSLRTPDNNVGLPGEDGTQALVVYFLVGDRVVLFPGDKASMIGIIADIARGWLWIATEDGRVKIISEHPWNTLSHLH